MMETLPNKKRACVLIVDHNLEYGIKLADWLAAHAYQAILVRSLETAINECRELRPQAVFIGLSFSEPVATLSLRRLFRTIKTASPHVPVITMGPQTNGDQTDIPNSGLLRHLHLPLKPLEFAYIGRLLRSELNAAVGSPFSPGTEPSPTTGRAIENRLQPRTAHQEVSTWIA
jgi:DNA-binding NtrC family response regulator